MLLLIDGYNIAQPVTPSRNPPPDWLRRAREGLLTTLAKHLDEELRGKTCVVFDAADPPRNRPSTYQYLGIEVRFAVDHVTADDLLEELIRAHHTPKRLMVVSSDHRVQVAAKRRGASSMDSEPWMDHLTDDRVVLAASVQRTGSQSSQRTGSPGEFESDHGAGQGAMKPKVTDPNEVEQWMKEFGFDPP